MAYFCAMKRSKYTFFTSFGCCALLFAACSGGDDGKTEPTDKVTESGNVPDVTKAPDAGNEPTAEPAATDEPTEAPTEAPTEEPKYTRNDPGTDFYFDYTWYAENEVKLDVSAGGSVDYAEEGMYLYATGYDPYIQVRVSDDIDPKEYPFLAIKLKAYRFDRIGQVRFSTTTDSRGWALVNYNYQETSDWQIVVVDLRTAMFLNDNTLDGKLTVLRIDSFNDENAEEAALLLEEDYSIFIESMALYKTEEEAKAFAGLYTWADQ